MADRGAGGARARSLKAALDRLYESYDFHGRLNHDPIKFPKRYKDARDVEVSGFIASALAYGQVEVFCRVVEEILARLGNGPYKSLLKFDVNSSRHLFSGLKYRLNDSKDILCLIYVSSELLKRHGSIQETFMNFYKHEDPDIGSALRGFLGYVRGIDTSRVYGNRTWPRGLSQFFPSPDSGGAFKKLCLFLRWMVRDTDIDFGIWEGIPKGKLVIPLDTHIARVSGCLGLTRRKAQGWKMAVEITEALRAMDPDDPLKYDFALCHRGIEGLCKSRGCTGCALKGYSA